MDDIVVLTLSWDDNSRSALAAAVADVQREQGVFA